MVWLTFINLNLDELQYYPFIVSMSRCDMSYNTIEDVFQQNGRREPESIYYDQRNKRNKDTRISHVSVVESLMVENISPNKIGAIISVKKQ